jgi:hypothetical protein
VSADDHRDPGDENDYRPPSYENLAVCTSLEMPRMDDFTFRKGRSVGFTTATPERACGSEQVHGPHEWYAGARRVQCYGVRPAVEEPWEPGVATEGVPLW